MSWNRWMIVMAAALALAAGVAQAQVPRPVVDRECTMECRRAHHACVDAARAAGRLCIAETCSAEQEAVEAACEANPASQECADARRALRACMQPCLEEYRADLSQCRAAAKDCMGGCPQVMPPPPPSVKDATCIGDCRAQLSNCLLRVRNASNDCQMACREKVAAMREACAAGRTAACAAAREALQECLTPCNQLMREGTATCTKQSNQCVAQCPDRAVRPEPPRPVRGQ